MSFFKTNFRYTGGDAIEHAGPFGYKHVDPAERYTRDRGCKWGGAKCVECSLPECVHALQDRYPKRPKRALVREMLSL